MLASIAGGPGNPKDSEAGTAKCTGCGMTFSDFAKSGRFGCGRCYTTFRPQIVKMLSKVHGATAHKGQMPSPTKVDLVSETSKETQLERDLRDAIAEEDFEKAARIRDQIRLSTTQKKK
jgi:protein arginine kinase activator